MGKTYPMKLLPGLLLLVSFVSPATASDPESLSLLDNLVENPSAEDDFNRDGRPDAWRGNPFDSPASLGWDENVARTGTRSLRMSDSARGIGEKDWKRVTARWGIEPRPVESGSEYRLEVWVKTEGVTGEAYAHLAWQKDSRWLSEVGTPRLSGTQDWTKLTVTATAPPGADELVVSLNLARSEGTAWFDDVKVSGRSVPVTKIDYRFNDTSDWFPFEFPTEDTNLDGIDLSGFLDAPAGKHGFVTTRPDGHFWFENGSRARFFGTNVGRDACAPEKERAPRIAARLAKYGVNLLRFHNMDGPGGPLIDYGRGTSQEFDAEGLDRMDYFIAELKKRSIYVYLDLLDYRRFRTAEGVTEGDEFTHNWAGSMKGASIFDERMIELQKDYATRLLTHKNPYTGLRYVDEPAIAVVEITNENSIFYFWRQQDLSRPHYRAELAKRWNSWLVGRYGARATLAEAWTDETGWCALGGEEDPAAGSVVFPFGMLVAIRPDEKSTDPLTAPSRVGDVLRFLAEIQERYYTVMRAHLAEIGVRVPVAGTNQMFVLADTMVEGKANDWISRNQYWRHPHRMEPHFRFANEPFVAVDIPTQRAPLSVISRTSVAGKPQGVAEFNFPWPNEYRCEGLLLAAAYSCLQDWDMFLLFSFGIDPEPISMFRSHSDPARWGVFPAAAALFHRADVAPAVNEVHVVHPEDSWWRPAPETRNARYTNFRFLTYTSKVRNSFRLDPENGGADVLLVGPEMVDRLPPDAPPTIRLDGESWNTWHFPAFAAQARQLGLPGYDRIDGSGKVFLSDTGELTLNYGEGLFAIDTPRTKAVVGFVSKQGPIDFGVFRIERAANEFCAITATSLDGEPLGESRRVLITSVGRAENRGQGFWDPGEELLQRSPMHWKLPAEGSRPVLAEPVDAEVHLVLPQTAQVYPLDPTGRRLEPLSRIEFDDRTLVFNPADARSIWCEVMIEE